MAKLISFTGATVDAAPEAVPRLIASGLFAAAPEAPADAEGEGRDLASLTNAELVALCRERGIEPPKKARKAELVALLEG